MPSHGRAAGAGTVAMPSFETAGSKADSKAATSKGRIRSANRWARSAPSACHGLSASRSVRHSISSRPSRPRSVAWPHGRFHPGPRQGQVRPWELEELEAGRAHPWPQPPDDSQVRVGRGEGVEAGLVFPYREGPGPARSPLRHPGTRRHRRGTVTGKAGGEHQPVSEAGSRPSGRSRRGGCRCR
jgi:hypothetical protein